MSDLISRQAAIDMIRLYREDETVDLDELESSIAMMPSAQPYTEEQIQTMQDLESAEIEKAYELGKESAQRELNTQLYTDGFCDGYAQCKKDKQWWIPCSERLPDTQDEYYITWTAPVCKGKRFVSITEYCVPSTGEDPYWDLSEHISFYEDAEVLAWMPLPEPWKGEER